MNREKQTSNRAIDAKLLKTFLEHSGRSLTGDWVLLGGAVLPALGIDHRATADIDFVSVHGAKTSDTMKLMGIAEKLGLPVDSINQAGGYFLFKLRSFRKHMVLLHDGPSANIYRPDLFLYISLKISRLSESDLLDCVRMISFCRKSGEFSEMERAKRLVNREIRKGSSAEKKSRLQQLANTLATD